MESAKKVFKFKLVNDIWRLTMQKVDNQSVRFIAVSRSQLNAYEQVYTVKQLQSQCKAFYIYSDPDPEELMNDIENVCKEEPNNERVQFRVKEKMVEFIYNIQVGRYLKDLVISIDEQPQNWKETQQDLLSRINKNEELILIGNSFSSMKKEDKNKDSAKFSAYKRLVGYEKFIDSFEEKIEIAQRISEDQLAYKVKKLNDNQQKFEKDIVQAGEKNAKNTRMKLKQYHNIFTDFKDTTMKIISKQQEATEKLIKKIEENAETINLMQQTIDLHQEESVQYRKLIK